MRRGPPRPGAAGVEDFGRNGGGLSFFNLCVVSFVSSVRALDVRGLELRRSFAEEVRGPQWMGGSMCMREEGGRGSD